MNEQVTITINRNQMPFELPALYQYGELRTQMEMHYNLHLGDQHHISTDGWLITYWKIYAAEDSPPEQTYVEVRTILRRVHEEPFKMLDSEIFVGGEIRQSHKGVQDGRRIVAEIHGNYLAHGWWFG